MHPPRIDLFVGNFKELAGNFLNDEAVLVAAVDEVAAEEVA